MNYLIGIDIGMTELKTILFDTNGSIISYSSSELRVMTNDEFIECDFIEYFNNTVRYVDSAGITGFILAGSARLCELLMRIDVRSARKDLEKTKERLGFEDELR